MINIILLLIDICDSNTIQKTRYDMELAKMKKESAEKKEYQNTRQKYNEEFNFTCHSFNVF